MKDFLEVIREFEGFREDVEKMAHFMIEKGGMEAALYTARAIEVESIGESHDEFLKGFFFGEVASYIRKTHLLN